jgi:hypothetical protein
VTGPKMVGAALPQLGAHSGHGDGRRGRRSRAEKSLRCGVVLGFLHSGARPLGVHRGGGGRK